jgi:DNA-binding NtrC family response regulator
VSPSGFTRRAIEALLSYDYPGNVREMQNLIERGVVFAEPDGQIDVTHMFRHGEKLRALAMQIGPSGTLLPSGGRDAEGKAEGRPTTVAEVERRLYTQALEQHAGNVAAAARAVGLSRPALEYRLRKFGLLKSRRGKRRGRR